MMIEAIVGISMMGIFAMTDLGNDNPSWKFIGKTECQSGKNLSGHAFTFSGNVFLKQKNADGSIGTICNSNKV